MQRGKKNRREIQDSSTYHKCEKDVECFTGSGSTNVHRLYVRFASHIYMKQSSSRSLTTEDCDEKSPKFYIEFPHLV